MSLLVDIFIEKGEIDTIKYKKFINDVLLYKKNSDVQFSITICDDGKIAKLNKEWRNKEGATDVLTFVMDEGLEFPNPENEPKELGDIIISIDSVLLNSRDLEIPMEEELKRVTVHGILHLLGYTHTDQDWDKGMLKEQEEILDLMKQIRILK